MSHPDAFVLRFSHAKHAAGTSVELRQPDTRRPERPAGQRKGASLMTTRAGWSIFVAASALLGAACVAAAPGELEDTDSEELVGAAEDIGSSEAAHSSAYPVGTTFATTANLNLRSGPSTSYKILHVIPKGAKVTLVQSSPQGGWYKIKHAGMAGWSHGNYLTKASSPSGGSSSGSSGGTSSASGSASRDGAISRAKAGKGFSYWWGHGRFRAEGPTSSTKGACYGSCPDCSHKGSYGGDCSGYVAKVWQVPSSNSSLSVDAHPYSTADFIKDSSRWSGVSRGSLKKADALVYRSGGAGHIFVYDRGDGWGSMYAYECKGCSYGCVAGYRKASSAYRAIRRKGY